MLKLKRGRNKMNSCGMHSSAPKEETVSVSVQKMPSEGPRFFTSANSSMKDPPDKNGSGRKWKGKGAGRLHSPPSQSPPKTLPTATGDCELPNGWMSHGWMPDVSRLECFLFGSTRPPDEDQQKKDKVENSATHDQKGYCSNPMSAEQGKMSLAAMSPPAKGSSFSHQQPLYLTVNGASGPGDTLNVEPSALTTGNVPQIPADLRNPSYSCPESDFTLAWDPSVLNSAEHMDGNMKKQWSGGALKDGEAAASFVDDEGCLSPQSRPPFNKQTLGEQAISAPVILVPMMVVHGVIHVTTPTSLPSTSPLHDKPPVPKCGKRKRSGELCMLPRTRRLGSPYPSLSTTTLTDIHSSDSNRRKRLRAFHAQELARELLADRKTAPGSILQYLDSIYGRYWLVFLEESVPRHPGFPEIFTRQTETGRRGDVRVESESLPSFHRQRDNTEGQHYPEVVWGMRSEDVMRALHHQKDQGLRTTPTQVVGDPVGRFRHMRAFMAHDAAHRILQYRHKMDEDARAWIDHRMRVYWYFYLNYKVMDVVPGEFQEISTTTEQVFSQ